MRACEAIAPARWTNDWRGCRAGAIASQARNNGRFTQIIFSLILHRNYILARLFIFAVGGTGARVLRSLTMLLAAGMRLPDCDQVIPVLVDPDTQNGDVTRTVDLLKRYKRIHDALYQDGQHPKNEGFFGQDLTTLAQLNTSGVEGLRDSFVYDFGGINQSFKDFMHYNETSVETRGLLDLLFTPDSLNASLDLGFRGSPNVGSVVLNSLVQAKEMRYLAQKPEPRRLGIFHQQHLWGYGRGGLPAAGEEPARTPAWIYRSPRCGRRCRPARWCCYPTSNCSSPRPRKKPMGRIFIDSNTFITKTKTALSYYAEHLDGLEALYYLGDQAGQPLPNHPGRAEQRNQAHLVEVLGALAISAFPGPAGQSARPGQPGLP